MEYSLRKKIYGELKRNKFSSYIDKEQEYSIATSILWYVIDGEVL
jgi:hypothetical protein